MDSEASAPLRAKWQELMTGLGVAAAASRPVFIELTAHYRSADRHYHNWAHVADVLATVEELAHLAAEPAAVELAAFFHDAVYDPRRRDNEARSAVLAQERLGQLGVLTALGEEVARLVRLTGTHRPEAEDANGCVLADADLAPLGAETTCYGQYAQAIRQEYAWVPPEQFRAGRAQVLQAFLRRARIYQTDLLYQRLEEQARRNLQAELTQLAQEE